MSGSGGSGGTGSGTTSGSGGSGGATSQGFVFNLPGANTGQMIDPNSFTSLSMGVSTVVPAVGVAQQPYTWQDAWNLITGKDNADMIRWGTSKLAGGVQAAGDWTQIPFWSGFAGGTSSLINSVGGMMAAAADPYTTVTNGAKSAYDTFNAASNKAGGGWYGTWFGVSAVTGIPKLTEAAYGVDIMTDEVLTPEQRVDRAIEGFGAACNVAAVVGGAGMSAATKLGFSVTCPKGNGWIANQARAQLDNKICFVAGTPISTEQGLRPIETIRPGDKVWSFDLVGGEWHLRPVLEKFERDYSADLVHVTFAGETIEATMLHPFYVLTGKDLDERPVRSHLEPPPENAGVPGRWVDATDLKPGDLLLLRDGRRVPVEQIQHVRSETTVHNFSVDQFRCYAVGTNAALVHNTHGGDADVAVPKRDKYRGGPHSNLSGPRTKGDGLDSHHMPDRHADPSVDPKDGPAIQMDPIDHYTTSSNGRHGAAGARYRAETARLVGEGKYRDAMAREIRDVRNAANTGSGNPSKYNGAIGEMLAYAKKSGLLPGRN